MPMPRAASRSAGTTLLSAVSAVLLYPPLPSIRNTYTAIRNDDPALRDAAREMGMSPLQRLVQARRRRDLRIARAVRLRQDDDAQDDQPADRAHLGQDLHQRQGYGPIRSGRAAPDDRLRDSADRPLSQYDGGREHLRRS